MASLGARWGGVWGAGSWKLLQVCSPHPTEAQGGSGPLPPRKVQVQLLPGGMWPLVTKLQAA